MCFLRYVCFKSKIYILIFVLKKIGVFKVAIIFFLPITVILTCGLTTKT